MGYWGKVVGGMAGFAVGGPFGAIMGAALGHAADTGGVTLPHRAGAFFNPANFHPARVAGLFTQREQVFALCVVSLAAKLAKADGPVNRAEIDAFKRHFRIPPENLRHVGRVFDQARDSSEDFEPYATQLGQAFADNPGLLEDVLGGLFGIARADGAVNDRELKFLSRAARAFALPGEAWDRARTGATRPQSNPDEPDPYRVLGVARTASDEEIRAAWKKLMRENHPDSLASRGVPQDFIDRASDTLILHYTGMQSADAAIARLCDPASRVSAHYVVEEDGTVHALVPEARRAWHAGISVWRGRRMLNDVSIGIEIVNPGHEWGYRPFPEAQIDALTALCQEILARHPIPARNVVAHSDVAPDRKQDPGELFPWRTLAAAGIGLWPDLADAGTAAAGFDAARATTALAKIGYDTAGPALDVILSAFQRHWRPETINGQADAGTVDRLMALLRLID